MCLLCSTHHGVDIARKQNLRSPQQLQNSQTIPRLSWLLLTAQQTTVCAPPSRCPASPPSSTSTTSTRSRRLTTADALRKTLWRSWRILSRLLPDNLHPLPSLRSSGEACKGRFF